MEKVEMKQVTGDNYHGGILGPLWSHSEYAKRAFPNWDYGHAFAYLWRRFGPPQAGSDPYKDLCYYYLSTAADGVVLMVSPKSGASYSFGFLLQPDLFETCCKAEVDNRGTGRKEAECPVKSPILESLQSAMEELKRPTYVRDVLINIEGPVADGYEDELAEYNQYAGYGILPEYFERFSEFKKEAMT